MTVRLSIGALLFGAAVALAGPGGAGATPAATGGKLVVVGFDLTTRDYAHDGLYTLNADGSDLRQVTQSTEDGEPHWSPDGRWIAYETDNSDEDLVSIVRDDGTGNRVVGHGSRFSNSLVSPSPWSPDGRRLAWSGCGGLCLLDLASGRLRSLGLGDDDSDGFAWSPDGRRLAAVDSSGRVLVLDATNGSVQIVVARVGSSLAWSADGRELSLFVPQKLGWQKLVIVSPKGGVRRVIANKTYDASWSPHGHRLLFDTRPPHDAADSVEVSDLVEGHAPRVVITDAGDAKWSPDGSQIVFIRSRWPGGGYYKEPDVWTVRLDGQGARRLTDAFPTGVYYSNPEWTAGSLSGEPQQPPALLALQASAQTTVDFADGALAHAVTPDSVAYDVQTICDYDAETSSSAFTVWNPAANTAETTTSVCQDFGIDQWAISGARVGWLIGDDLGFNATVTVASAGADGTELRSWSDATDDSDIGYRNDLTALLGDGSTIYFASRNDDDRWALWRITEESPPHAAQVPLPADAAGALDAAAGQIALVTTDGSLEVITSDGAVVSRTPPLVPPAKYGPPPLTATLGDDVAGTVLGTTLRVYRTADASLITQLPLATAAGPPVLLSIDDDYAVYVSGIELHLLRLRDGLDQVLDLPGQAGPVGALLTSAGLFVSYNQAYDTEPGRILFVPAANLP